MLKPELLTGENKILYELCDKKFNAMKYLSFCNYPRILVILLKRFKYNRDFNKIEKINNYIEFPINLVFDINNNLFQSFKRWRSHFIRYKSFKNKFGNR